MTGILIRKERFRDTQGEHPVVMEAETGVKCLQAKEPREPQEAGREARKDSSLGPSEGAQLC